MKELVNFIRTLYHKIDDIVNTLPYEIVFVMGNSSCDLDSALSSILLSFLRNIESKSITYTCQKEITYNNYSKINKLYIPVINCPKGELFWRLDIKELFETVQIEQTDFFYYTDVFDKEGKVIFNSFLKKPAESKF